MNAIRKVIVAEIRVAGRLAYKEGRSLESNPYAQDRDMNTYQWLQGWFAAEREHIYDCEPPIQAGLIYNEAQTKLWR